MLGSDWNRGFIIAIKRGLHTDGAKGADESLQSGRAGRGVKVKGKTGFQSQARGWSIARIRSQSSTARAILSCGHGTAATKSIVQESKSQSGQPWMNESNGPEPFCKSVRSRAHLAPNHLRFRICTTRLKQSSGFQAFGQSGPQEQLRTRRLHACWIQFVPALLARALYRPCPQTTSRPA